MVIEHLEILEKVNHVLGQDYKNKSFLETIEALVGHIEKVDREFISMSQSIAEDEVIIEQLQDDKEIIKNYNKMYLERNAKLKNQLQMANERIKELESLPQKMEKLHFEQRFLKAGYMDLDD